MDNWFSRSAAESNFSLRITKDNKRKTGWRILPIFVIELHKRDITLLKYIQTFFGVGTLFLRTKKWENNFLCSVFQRFQSKQRNECYYSSF